MKANLDWPGRLRAAGIHLVLSAAVAAAAAALVFGLWFPWPYREVSGGSELFMLLVSVDGVLGPLITLAVFNRAKPRAELARDLAVVVLLQLGALAYGLHTVHAARPVVLALEVDRFRVVPAVSVVESELPQAPPALRTLPLDGPRLIGTVQPTGQERADALFAALAGADLGMRPRYWAPWDDAARQQARKAARPATELAARGAAQAAALAEGAARAGRPLDALGVLPLLARTPGWSVLVDRASGEVVGFAAADF
jgi:hypothetical protein